MLPFTPVPFVPRSAVSSDQPPLQNDAPVCSTSSPSSSSFYQSVTAGSRSIMKPTVPLERPVPSKGAIKLLYNLVCGDNVSEVEDWVKQYVDRSSPDLPVSHILEDQSGSEIAMACISHKSYHCFKFFLRSLPSLLTRSSYYGRGLWDFVKLSGDETVQGLLAYFPPIKAEPTRKSRAPNMYCSLCRVSHSDPTHETSISHVFAEQREVPELNPHLDPGSVGYQMMRKSGWAENRGLGPSGDGRKQLIKTHLKKDRKGFGTMEKQTAKVTHFDAFDNQSVEGIFKKRKITLKTEGKKKKKKSEEKGRQWEIDLRREMNQL